MGRIGFIMQRWFAKPRKARRCNLGQGCDACPSQAYGLLEWFTTHSTSSTVTWRSRVSSGVGATDLPQLAADKRNRYRDWGEHFAKTIYEDSVAITSYRAIG